MNYSQIIPEAFQNPINNNPYQNEIPLYNNQNNNIQPLGSMMESQRMMIDIYKRNQQNTSNNPNNEINVEQNNNDHQIIPPNELNMNNQNKVNSINPYPENLNENGKNENNEKDSNEEEDCQYDSAPQVNNGFLQDFENKENINLNSNINPINIKKDDEKEKQNEENEPKNLGNFPLNEKDKNVEIKDINYEGNSLPQNRFNLENPYLNERYPPVYPEEIIPVGPPLFPSNDEPIIPPYQVPLPPPNQEIVYPPQNIPLNPPKGIPIYPPQPNDFSSKNQEEEKKEKLESEEKNKDSPKEVLPNIIPGPAIPFYPPVEGNLDHSNERPFYPLIEGNLNPVHEIPFYPPVEGNLNPVHEIPFYPPVGVPPHPPHGMPYFPPPPNFPPFPSNQEIIDPAHEVPLDIQEKKESDFPNKIPSNQPNETNDSPKEISSNPQNETNDSNKEISSDPTKENKNSNKEFFSNPENETNNSHKEIPSNPPNELNDFPKEIPSYPPNGESLFSPHEEPLYMPSGVQTFSPQIISDFPQNGIQIHPTHGIPPFHPHGIPLYPPHGISPFPPHRTPTFIGHEMPHFIPHGIPVYPPHGMPPFHPHGVSLYPPHGMPQFSPHGMPLHPPHGEIIYPSHEIPSFAPNGETSIKKNDNENPFSNKEKMSSSPKNENENKESYISKNDNENPSSSEPNKESSSPKKENEGYSSLEILSNPQNQEILNPPYKRVSIPPYEGPFHPPLGEPVYPPNEVPLYPLYPPIQEPLYPPPLGEPVYPLYEGPLPPLHPPIPDPLYPPIQGRPLNPPFQEPLYPSYEEVMNPPIQEGFYPQYQGDLKNCIEQPFSREKKEEFEIPTPKIPIENINSDHREVNSKNPNEFRESNVVVIDNEPFHENPNNNRIHPPKNSIPSRIKNLTKNKNNEEQPFPQQAFYPQQNQKNISFPQPNNSQNNLNNNESLKEDEKEVSFHCNNGEIFAEQQYNDKNINNYNYQLYQQSYQGYNYYPPPYDYNREGGYYPVAYPPQKNNIANENMPLNELEYNNSQNQFTRRRIKRLYTGNNNTILEVNEENNKPSVKISENSKNQIIQENLNDNGTKKIEDYSEKMKDNKEENGITKGKNENEEDIINKKNKLDENGIIIEEPKIESKEKKLDQKVKFNKGINYEKIPLYIDTEINRLLIAEETQCPLKPLKENNLKDVDSLPIVIINEDKIYYKFIHFIETNFKYREFKYLPIFKKKLILPKSSLDINQYQEYHYVNNENINKFANITNSFESSIYDAVEINSIIDEIKDTFNKDDKFFNEFISKWVYTVIDLIVEFIQFELKKISYFYYCNNCHFPFLYISDNNVEELNTENNNNDVQIINNSIYIFEDLMKVIDIHKYNNKNNKNVENMINVIYYEEENNYINAPFEEEINGIFIPCSNMKSFDKVMNEIHDKNIYKYGKDSININTNYNYMFELIISEIYVEKIFNYLINSNYLQFFKGMCILINEKEDNSSNNILLQIKKKYIKYTKDFYIAQNDIISFLQREKQDANYRNNKNYFTSYPIIDYTNYLTKYNKLHNGASFYYNKYSINSYEIIEKVFIDFLITIDNFKKRPKSANDSYILIQKINKKIENEKKIFNIIKLFIEIKDKLNNNIKNEIDENINNLIQNYINDNNSFINDFNYWLNKLDKLAHQKFCYFIGSLMYNLDNSSLYYNNENYKGEMIEDNNDKLILYKELSGNYIDLLLYQKNLNQIITFPSFLFCFEKNNNNSKEMTFSKKEDKYQILYRIKYNLNSQNDYINLIFDLYDSKLFQLFTFYKINDMKIQHNIGKAIIDLEPINKKEFLENKIKENNTIYYNPNFNIMESIYYEDIFNNNSNINQNSFSYDNDRSNIYITSTVNTSKYLLYFNNQFNKNLNPDMTSVILENSNLKNFGLKLLSKIKFKDLVVLNLDNNKISDLTPLKDCNFPKLKKLSFASDEKTPLKDKIKDLSPLTGCNFPDLFILNLKNNLIDDISYLLFMNFPNLIILNLSYNKIKSIHVFSKVNFPKLETLDLCNNQINDITPLINNSSGKKNKIPKSIENNKSNSSLMNSANISTLLSKSQNNSEILKKHFVLPSLKILKIKHNKLNIDEGYLMTVKVLRNRGVTIFK